MQRRLRNRTDWIFLLLVLGCSSEGEGAPDGAGGRGEGGMAGSGIGGAVSSSGAANQGGRDPGPSGGMNSMTSGGSAQSGASAMGGSAQAGALSLAGAAGNPAGGTATSPGSAGSAEIGGGAGGPAGGSSGGPAVGGSSGSGGVTTAGGGSSAIGAGAGGLPANGGSGGAVSGADPKFLIFLLLGQSNMEGTPQPQAQDRETNPRIKVLAYDNCQNINRKYNEWYTAAPPLHSCGAGVGPGDYFARTLLAALPSDYTIGLVPCAVNGAPIDTFRKGVRRTGYTLPPDNHWETGYEWIVSRAQLAQKSGVIRGILFHQGESDNGQAVWVDKVSGLVNDLRTDLGIGDVPFLAGELYHRGCCPGHNALVKQLTERVTNGFLISAEGLNGTDQYHFDLAGQRELGTRYGEAMQQALQLR